MLRKFIGVGLAAIVLAAASGLASVLEAQPTPDTFPCTCALTAEQWVWGDVEVRTFSCDPLAVEPWQLRVLEHGQVVYADGGYRLHASGADLPPLGTDVTGDGRPNLVVREWTGGAHGKTKLHVFELEPRFRLLQKIDAGHSASVRFEDVDGDGSYEVVAHDWTFAGWRGYSFAETPAPQIALSWQDGAFRLDHTAMAGEAPPVAALAQRASVWAADKGWVAHPTSTVRASMASSALSSVTSAAASPTAEASLTLADGDPPAGLLAEVLHLIYTGHADAGWRLLAESWPEGRPGHDAFALDLLGRLSESPHWLDLDVSAR